MRRSHDAVAASAGRRLAELTAQLERAGVPRVEPRVESRVESRVEPDPVAPAVSWASPPVVAAEELVDPVVPAEPGRHSRGEPRRSRPADWLADRMPPWLRGRVALGGGHVAVLALGVVLAVAVTAWLLHRPAAEVDRVAVEPIGAEQPGTDSVDAPSPGAALVTPSAGPSGDAAEPSGVVVVDVAGKVKHPGVLTLPAGSRVGDAISRAGGPRAGVSLTALNLARVLVDGEQILVGVAPAAGVAAPAAGAPSAAGNGPLVNINTAGLTELDGLPGVGPVTAQKILDWRQSHGAFSSVDELLEIDGIGEKTLAQMASRVTL